MTQNNNILNMAKENNVPEIVRRRPKKLGVTKGADFSERQKLILDSAATLFAESGYAHTTIGDIADEMGVTKPVIYHYFENKDALIRAIFEETDRVCARGWQDIETEGASGLEKLKRLFFFHGELATTDLGRCVIKTSYPLLSAETREYKATSDNELNKEFVRLVNQGIRDGSVRKCDAKILAGNFIAIISHLGRQFDRSFKNVSLFLNETWDNLSHGLQPRE